MANSLAGATQLPDQTGFGLGFQDRELADLPEPPVGRVPEYLEEAERAAGEVEQGREPVYDSKTQTVKGKDDYCLISLVPFSRGSGAPGEWMINVYVLEEFHEKRPPSLEEWHDTVCFHLSYLVED